MASASEHCDDSILDFSSADLAEKPEQKGKEGPGEILYVKSEKL